LSRYLNKIELVGLRILR